ncbi:hypothetical protein [Streptococcus suis]|uniref:hypothetical protein n=1 Tax=Streptococcus suis TaxID=1307 RepID=UPI00300FF208
MVSVVYALILAATGFVYARVSESALSGNQQVFLTSSLIAVGFFICDIYFDYLPRYLKLNYQSYPFLMRRLSYDV